MKTTAIENARDNKTAKNQVTDKSAILPAVPLKEADKNEIKEEPKPEITRPMKQNLIPSCRAMHWERHRLRLTFAQISQRLV